MLKEEFEAFHRDDLDVSDKTIYRIKAEGDTYSVSWGNKGDSMFYFKHEIERLIEEGKWVVVSDEEKTDTLFTEKINYNTNYKVHYKTPTTKYDDSSNFKTYIGKLDNFVPTGLCAFMNVEGEMLHVHYRDIIQMSPTKESK